MIEAELKRAVESSQALLVDLMERSEGPLEAFTTIFGALSLMHLMSPPWARETIETSLTSLLDAMKERPSSEPPGTIAGIEVGPP